MAVAAVNIEMATNSTQLAVIHTGGANEKMAAGHESVAIAANEIRGDYLNTGQATVEMVMVSNTQAEIQTVAFAENDKHIAWTDTVQTDKQMAAMVYKTQAKTLAAGINTKYTQIA